MKQLAQGVAVSHVMQEQLPPAASGLDTQVSPAPDQRPEPAQPLFFDAQGNLIMQFNLISCYPGAEKK